VLQMCWCNCDYTDKILRWMFSHFQK